MKECKPQDTPIVTRQVNNRELRRNLDENDENLERKSIPYREAIEVYFICMEPQDLTLLFL